jgi:hypothetical protein
MLEPHEPQAPGRSNGDVLVLIRARAPHGAGLSRGIIDTIKPVIQVAKKIRANGSHVPATLLNITRLRWTTPATRKRSRTATRAVHAIAVGSADDDRIERVERSNLVGGLGCDVKAVRFESLTEDAGNAFGAAAL